MRHRQPRSPPRPPRISRHWNRPVPRNALPRTEESRRVTRATPVRPRRHAFVSTEPSVRRDRFDELHTIQTYTVRGMRELLRRGGFNLLGTFAATNVKKGFRPVSRNTFRIMAVARARLILNMSPRYAQPLPRK